jgi:endonuclease/exonuclease/phosphatase (EEP) superfamily protein YafD
MHAINLLSYNLNFNAAYSELTELALTHTAELVCLQECYADTLTAMIAGLALAAKTTTGKLGLAIYCDSSRFTVIGSSSIPMCLSTYARLYTQDRERLLIAELFDNINQQSIFVASFHATHFVAPNSLRRKQLSAALAILNTLSTQHPVVLAGDFNYPFFHNKLRQTAQKFNYTLRTTPEPTFYGRKFRGRFDMAATARINSSVQALPFGLSDHAPILMRLTTS